MQTRGINIAQRAAISRNSTQSALLQGQGSSIKKQWGNDKKTTTLQYIKSNRFSFSLSSSRIFFPSLSPAAAFSPPPLAFSPRCLRGVSAVPVPLQCADANQTRGLSCAGCWLRLPLSLSLSFLVSPNNTLTKMTTISYFSNKLNTYSQRLCKQIITSKGHP